MNEPVWVDKDPVEFYIAQMERDNDWDYYKDMA